MPESVDEFLTRHVQGGNVTAPPVENFLAKHVAAGKASADRAEKLDSDPLWKALESMWEEHVATRANEVASSKGRLANYKPNPEVWAKSVLVDAIKAGNVTTADDIASTMEWAGNLQSAIDRSSEVRKQIAAFPQGPEGRARAAIAEKPWYYKAALQGYNAYESAAEVLPGAMELAEALNPGAAAASVKLKAALSDVQPAATAITGAVGQTAGTIAGLAGAGVVPYSVARGVEPHLVGVPTEEGFQKRNDTTVAGDIARELINNVIMFGALKAAEIAGARIAAAVAAGKMTPLAAKLLTRGASEIAGALAGAAVQTVTPHVGPEGLDMGALKEWQTEPNKAAGRFAGTFLGFLLGRGTGKGGRPAAPEGTRAEGGKGGGAKTETPPGTQPDSDTPPPPPPPSTTPKVEEPAATCKCPPPRPRGTLIDEIIEFMRNASQDIRRQYRESREKYREKLAEISRTASETLAQGGDLEATARTAYETRNALRALERESYPPEVRARLEASDKSQEYVGKRGATFEERVKSYMKQGEGMPRDQALHKVIEGAGKSNADVDAALRGPYPGD